MAENDAIQIKKLGFAGGGNMAEALIRGVLAARLVAPEHVVVSEPSLDRRRHLTGTYGVSVVEDNTLLSSECDVIVVAVKPAIVDEVLSRWGGLEPSHTLVVSVCAGVRLQHMEAALPPGTRVVRAMPNTPAMHLAGATAITTGTHASEADATLASTIFEAVGICVRCEESELDAVTGLSGSGPAYVMLMMEALIEGGVAAGLPAAVALRLASQTVFGAAKLQIETGLEPAVLRERVSSPGGTTVAGLQALRDHGFESAVLEAISAATARSQELGGAKRDET